MDKHIYDSSGNHIGRVSDSPTAFSPEGFLEFFGLFLVVIVVFGFIAIGAIYVILWLFGH